MWLFWKMCEMFEMFTSQGRSGSHLLKKPGRGLPDSGWSASGSACCAGHLCGTSSGWILQYNCSWWFPWSVHRSGSCGCSWWFGLLLEQLVQRLGLLSLVSLGTTRWGLWCSWGYIGAGQRSSLDSIWMMFGMWSRACLYWPPPNDLNQVWAMFGFTNGCGWDPEGLGIIEYRDSLSTYNGCFGLQWRSWYAALWVAWLLRWSLSAAAWGPCAWSFGAQLFWSLSGRASQLVNEGGHWWVCSCMPTRQGRGPALNIWHGWGDLLQPWQLLRLGHYSLGS